MNGLCVFRQRGGLIQALAGMRPPGEDIEDRAPVWDYMQNFWMDTDPAILLPEVARICAEWTGQSSVDTQLPLCA